jgi:hypothetical protein
MFHMKRPRLLSGLLLAGLLVAGCADAGGDSGTGQGATTVPTTVPGNPPTTTQPPAAGQITVTGMVVEGSRAAACSWRGAGRATCWSAATGASCGAAPGWR